MSTTGGTCAADVKMQRADCDLGALAPGQSVVLTVELRPRSTGDFVDAAQVSASSPSDPVPDNDSARVTTTITH